MDKVAAFLTCVEDAFGLASDDSKVAAILETLIVSKPRSKELRATKSWSTNCLIRLFHSHASLRDGK